MGMSLQERELEAMTLIKGGVGTIRGLCKEMKLHPSSITHILRALRNKFLLSERKIGQVKYFYVPRIKGFTSTLRKREKGDPLGHLKVWGQ